MLLFLTLLNAVYNTRALTYHVDSTAGDVPQSCLATDVETVKGLSQMQCISRCRLKNYEASMKDGVCYCRDRQCAVVSNSSAVTSQMTSFSEKIKTKPVQTVGNTDIITRCCFSI